MRSVHIALARAMDQALQDGLGDYIAAAMAQESRPRVG
jgi:hypothetical protein